RVTARRPCRALRVAPSAVRPTGRPSAGVAAAVGTYKLAVILINFTNNTSQPWTTTAVRDAIFNSSTSLAAFYNTESFGKTTVTGDVFGWYTIASTNLGCNWPSWGGLGSAAAQAAGV